MKLPMLDPETVRGRLKWILEAHERMLLDGQKALSELQERCPHAEKNYAPQGREGSGLFTSTCQDCGKEL